jgi:hypothetical protein
LYIDLETSVSAEPGKGIFVIVRNQKFSSLSIQNGRKKGKTLSLFSQTTRYSDDEGESKSSRSF